MLFKKGRSAKKSAKLLIDIGSGSVGMAVVKEKETPEDTGVVLWSHREYVLVRTKEIGKNTLKDIDTALFNAFLEFNGNGLSKVGDADIEINSVVIAVCSPWAFTATKKVQYEKESAFSVDALFIKELGNAAKDSNAETLSKLGDIGLSVISKNVVEVRLNDYVTRSPEGKTANHIALTLITSAVSQKLQGTLHELIEKTLPKAHAEMYSFIDVLYRSLTHHKPYTQEACILDITDESTELGIIRDDVLQHTGGVTMGINTLVRALTSELGVPRTEASGILKLTSAEVKEHYSALQAEIVAQVKMTYQGVLAELMEDTGDELRTPSTVFLHTDAEVTQCLSEMLKEIRRSTGGSPLQVLKASSELFGNVALNDSALGTLAYFVEHKLGEKSVI